MVDTRRRNTNSFADDNGYGAFGHVDREIDRRILEDVCERLAEDAFIDPSTIKVDVKGRNVTLSGMVASRGGGVRYRAEDIVETVPGVAHVQNNLRIDSTP